MYGFGVGSEAVGKQILEAEGFSKHARVVIVVSIALAIHMCAAKVMMMGNKRGAHATSFRREAAIKAGSCVYILEKCGKGAV